MQIHIHIHLSPKGEEHTPGIPDGSTCSAVAQLSRVSPVSIWAPHTCRVGLSRAAPDSRFLGQFSCLAQSRRWAEAHCRDTSLAPLVLASACSLAFPCLVLALTPKQKGARCEVIKSQGWREREGLRDLGWLGIMAAGPPG